MLNIYSIIFYQVDENGFFVFWKSGSREGEVIETSQINDIRSF